MTMKNEKVTDHLQNFCLNGCNKDFSSNTKGPCIIDSEIKVFGQGMKFSFNPIDFRIKVSHSSTEGITETTDTSAGFELGDSDPRDDFFLDLFFDKQYGTIIFDTVAGCSKYPNEDNTIALEIPSLEISKKPS